MAHNLEYTTNIIQLVPSATLGQSVTPSGTAWASSAWAQLTASTSSAITLAGITVNPGTANDFEVDIGTGAAGSETVVATLGGAVRSAVGSDYFLPFPIAISNVATSTRVAVRMRKAGTGTTAWRFTLWYYANPVAGNVTTTANASQIIPTAAVGASITPSATPWANPASWTQLIASTSSAIIVGGVVINPGVATEEWEVDLGTGAASSESVITTIRGRNATLTGGAWYFPFENPLDNIATSTRVAARIRASGTTATAWTIKMIYYAKPL